MRCNRPKPIFGKFQILCGILIVSVIFGINAISSVEAVTDFRGLVNGLKTDVTSR